MRTAPTKEATTEENQFDQAMSGLACPRNAKVRETAAQANAAQIENNVKCNQRSGRIVNARRAARHSIDRCPTATTGAPGVAALPCWPVGVYNQPLAGDAMEDGRVPPAANLQLKDVGLVALLGEDDMQALEGREVGVDDQSACRRAGDEDSSALVAFPCGQGVIKNLPSAVRL